MSSSNTKKKKKDTPQCALVTGADGGIGTEICRQLSLRGIHIIAVSINAEGLGRLIREMASVPDSIITPLRIDLTLPDATHRLMDFLDQAHLEPDMLVNNAGIFSFMPTLCLSDRKLESFIDLHVRSVTELSVAFGRRFAGRGRGWIVNMASMSCWMPMPGLSMYSATKSYIRVFSRSLEMELRDNGVHVLCATPGGIATDLFGLSPKLKKLALRIGAIQAPDQFAAKLVKRALNGKRTYVNGLLNRISIPLVCSLPSGVRMLVKHKMLDRGIVRP